MDKNLNHFDPGGKAVMVDVSEKAPTVRTAVATGCVTMNAAAFEAVASGAAAKGDVLGVARVAGIMATKRTAELIPMCHPLSTEQASVDFELLAESRTVRATCTVKTSGKTGVEMEALCGANIALLTVYDMCKAVDRAMTLHSICLLEKQGGRSGHYKREESCND